MSDYSDNESIASTYSESLQTTDIYDSLELGKNQNAYKSDKNCVICSCKFGKIGIAHARKHYCKFCYRGVCAKCSPQVAVHPVLLTKLRVCNNCCQKAVINKFTENFRLDIDSVKVQQEQTLREISKVSQETESIKLQTSQFEDEFENEQRKEVALIQQKKINLELERGLDNKSKDREQLMGKNKELRTKIDALDKIIKDLNSQITTIKVKREEFQKETSVFKDVLAEKQDKSVITKREIDEKKSKIMQNASWKEDYERIEKLKVSISELQLFIQQELKERDENVKTISVLTDEHQALIVKIKELKAAPHDKLVPTAGKEFSPDEEERFAHLKHLQREKQARIESLKVELKKREPKAEDPLDYELTTKDSTRPCVRCVIS